MSRTSPWLLLAVVLLGVNSQARGVQTAEIIYINGNLITVDSDFALATGMAVADGRILRVGSTDEVLETQGPETQVIDLRGTTVVPGLIDSHTHPTGASMHEFDHPIAEMETIEDVLRYIKERAELLGEGKWVIVRQVFITRLKEQRYPTKEELDRAAPRNPVLFATGPDASLNSLALDLSGIDETFEPEGPGKVERDPKTGIPTGILRNLTRYVKTESPGRTPTRDEEDEQLTELFYDYNSVGITSIIDRNASSSAVEQYARLHDANALTVRIGLSHAVGSSGPLEEIEANIRQVAEKAIRTNDSMLRTVGIKMFLDGGMLTGSAYMREPWGVSEIYSIDDPKYRGVLFIPPERLQPLVRATVRAGLQFTAHSVGDGAVHALLDAYEAVNNELPVAPTRPCLTHSNFMSRESIEQAARLGVVVDIQPAWLYLDTRTLVAQFGYDRLRYFQPLQSLFQAGVTVGGGSDHMQKIGSFRSINPYNPFLGMWVATTRQAKGYEGSLHPEEALTREQVIQFYTINNAKLMFLEDEIGSLEAGKRADFVLLDRDILTCSGEELIETKVLATYLGGKLIHEHQD
ncbi:amidohydrolase [Tautonia marina]|uniref:amidohydrolase n=1 Tax=Tautonia marina TaxID=2653855 RepID=UPI0012610A70|nr:amidohydrolase [Tautonia marina]